MIMLCWVTSRQLKIIDGSQPIRPNHLAENLAKNEEIKLGQSRHCVARRARKPEKDIDPVQSNQPP
ncbi:hypothetical protein OAA27_01015 [bacterium]|nr:hypothetical protein [bacterium]MDC0295450.1 hypothetical protein [bacterium]